MYAKTLDDSRGASPGVDTILGRFARRKGLDNVSKDPSNDRTSFFDTKNPMNVHGVSAKILPTRVFETLFDTLPDGFWKDIGDPLEPLSTLKSVDFKDVMAVLGL